MALLPDDTLKYEYLIHALQEAIEAKVEHDKARDAYDGYSWGYFGHSYVEKMEDKARIFGREIDKLITEKLSYVFGRKE